MLAICLSFLCARHREMPLDSPEPSVAFAAEGRICRRQRALCVRSSCALWLGLNWKFNPNSPDGVQMSIVWYPFCKMVRDFSTAGVTASASLTRGPWLTHLLHSLLIILSLLFWISPPSLPWILCCKKFSRSFFFLGRRIFYFTSTKAPSSGVGSGPMRAGGPCRFPEMRSHISRRGNWNVCQSDRAAEKRFKSKEIKKNNFLCMKFNLWIKFNKIPSEEIEKIFFCACSSCAFFFPVCGKLWFRGKQGAARASVWLPSAFSPPFTLAPQCSN